MQAFWSQRCVDSQHVFAGAILVKDGIIDRIVFSKKDIPKDYKLFDCGNDALLPGLVDTHVHINEPGRTDWEGFYTATQAACAGGVTCIVDMPLNCLPVTTSKEALDVKLASLSQKLWVDCGFYAGLVPDNVTKLKPLLQSGVLGIKAFLVHSGIDEFPNVTRQDLEAAMPIIAAYKIPLLVHAELESCISGSKPKMRSFQDFVQSRPKHWEEDAIRLLCSLSEKYSCPVHIVHLSAETAIPIIASARKRGVPISAETCPHYLHFCSEEIAPKDARFKCTPPIREKINQDKLWHGLLTGDISFIVSDHSPCPPELKNIANDDYNTAWGGIASLQLALPIVWSHHAIYKFDLPQIVRWLATRPAEFVGLSKGDLKPGMDADFVIFSPEEPYVVCKKNLYFRHKDSPYLQEKLQGVIKKTYIRGQLQFTKESGFLSPIGKIILKKS